jgi:hypothetical protein
VDLWLAGNTNPARSVGSGICKLQSTPAYAAVFAMFRSGHLPEPNDSLALANPHSDSTCPKCNSEVTLPAVPPSARDLPWVHIIHRLLLCHAEQGRPPLFNYFPERMRSAPYKLHYHRRLGIIFPDLNIPPSDSASSCIPFPSTRTSSACLLISFGFPVGERTYRWQAMLAISACFLRSMCSALFSPTPSQPLAHTCSTPCTTDTSTTLNSLVHLFARASVTSVLLGSPGFCPPSRLLGPAFPVVVTRYPLYLVLQTRSAMMRFPFLGCMSRPPLSLLSVLLPLRLMMKFPFSVSHNALLWFRVTVMLRFISLAPVFLALPPPSPLVLFALNMPCRLEAAADALLGSFTSDLLLLLFLPYLLS